MEVLPRINTEFHDLLYALSRSPRLIRMINELRDQIFRFRKVLLRSEELARTSSQDHQLILELIRKRDAEAVDRLVREHIDRGKQAVTARTRSMNRALTQAGAKTHMGEKRIRVLLAKPGLDGHDRGAKVVAHALREAGMEVIYTGLHQTVPSILNQAIQEDVDVIGLSIMSGAHLPICRKLTELMKKESVTDKLIVVGGVIPSQDVPVLGKLGVHGVFPGGTRFEEITRFIQAQVA